MDDKDLEHAIALRDMTAGVFASCYATGRAAGATREESSLYAMEEANAVHDILAKMFAENGKKNA